MSDLLEQLPRPDQLRERLRDNLRERFALRRLLRLVVDLDEPIETNTSDRQEVGHER